MAGAEWGRGERKSCQTDSPYKPCFNKPLPPAAFHWLGWGTASVYSSVPVIWWWLPRLSTPYLHPPFSILSCQQQQQQPPAFMAFAVFVLHLWFQINCKIITSKFLQLFGFQKKRVSDEEEIWGSFYTRVWYHHLNTVQTSELVLMHHSESCCCVVSEFVISTLKAFKEECKLFFGF